MRILYIPNEFSQQRQYDIRANIYPVLLAMEATYYAQQGHEVFWGCRGDRPSGIDKIVVEPEGLPFHTLPAPDRALTRAWEYQDNGNFRRLPGTYIQAARDCWYHKCTFCRWAKRWSHCELRSVSSVISEIGECIDWGFRDIFDDSGTFPVNSWLISFCKAMVDRGYNKKVEISCNMRFGVLRPVDFEMMKAAGFRMLLWGLESVNQVTLDKLNKGTNIGSVLPALKATRKAGLWNHVAVMFGYPWETYETELRTLDFVRWGLKRGLIQSAQASVYDAEHPLNLKAWPEHPLNLKAWDLRRQVYKGHFNPIYLARRLVGIRDLDDIKYYLRGVKKIWKKIL